MLSFFCDYNNNAKKCIQIVRVSLLGRSVELLVNFIYRVAHDSEDTFRIICPGDPYFSHTILTYTPTQKTDCSND